MAEQEIFYYNLTSLDTKPKDVLNPKKFVSDVIGHKDNDYYHYSKHNTEAKNYYPIINSTDIYWNGFELTYTNESGEQVKKNIKTTQDLMSILSSMMSYTNILKEKYKNQSNNFDYTISVYTQTITEFNNLTSSLSVNTINTPNDDINNVTLYYLCCESSYPKSSLAPTDIIKYYLGGHINTKNIDLYKLFYKENNVKIDNKNLPTYGDLVFDYIEQLYDNDKYNLLTFMNYPTLDTYANAVWYVDINDKEYLQFYTYYTIAYDELNTYITYKYNGKLYSEFLNKNQLNTYINPEYTDLKIYLPLKTQYKHLDANNNNEAQKYIMGSDLPKLYSELKNTGIYGNNNNTCLYALYDNNNKPTIFFDKPINIYKSNTNLENTLGIIPSSINNNLLYEFKHLYLYNDISSKANTYRKDYIQYITFVNSNSDMHDNYLDSVKIDDYTKLNGIIINNSGNEVTGYFPDFDPTDIYYDGHIKNPIVNNSSNINTTNTSTPPPSPSPSTTSPTETVN